jgi:AbiU2
VFRPIFFHDIHYLLQRNLVLVICNITDPAGTGDHTNLTVEFLIKYSDFSSAPNTSDKLKELDESMRAFRKKIARNKLIAHLDRESVQLGQPLGGAPQEDWLQFWLDLQDFLYIMHKRYVDPNSHFYLNAIAQSDAEMLVEALNAFPPSIRPRPIKSASCATSPAARTARLSRTSTIRGAKSRVRRHGHRLF